MATPRGNGRKFCFLGSNGDPDCVLARLSHTIDHPPNPPPVLGEDMIDTLNATDHGGRYWSVE